MLQGLEASPVPWVVALGRTKSLTASLAGPIDSRYIPTVWRPAHAPRSPPRARPARPAARKRASASPKSVKRRRATKPASPKPTPRTNRHMTSRRARNLPSPTQAAHQLRALQACTQETRGATPENCPQCQGAREVVPDATRRVTPGASSRCDEAGHSPHGRTQGACAPPLRGDTRECVFDCG